jgi:preprotein translocase subunit SecG
MLSYLLVTLYVLICLFLLIVVLLQQGRGGDIASAFGGGGSQTAFGARQGATVLTRATAVLSALFLIGAIVLSVVGQRGPSSVLSGVGGAATPATPASTPQAPGSTPGTQTPAPAPAPQGQAPVPSAPAGS